MVCLVKIKQLKERKLQNAETELRTADREMKAVKTRLNEAEKAAENYQQWRTIEEDKQYKRLENKCLSVTKLDEFRASISALHDQEAKLKQNAIELKHQLEISQEHKRQCLEAVRCAEKNMEKYVLLIQETEAEALVLQERQSENVLDEFASATTKRN